MTLQEYVDHIRNEMLSDKAIKAKWDKLCDVLKAHDASAISEMVSDGALNGLVEIECMDGFGPEGMQL